MAIAVQQIRPIAHLPLILGVYGVQPYHLMVCDALGLDHTWYAVANSP